MIDTYREADDITIIYSYNIWSYVCIGRCDIDMLNKKVQTQSKVNLIRDESYLYLLLYYIIHNTYHTYLLGLIFLPFGGAVDSLSSSP
jgi:hypothetical protein